MEEEGSVGIKHFNPHHYQVLMGSGLQKRLDLSFTSS